MPATGTRNERKHSPMFKLFPGLVTIDTPEPPGGTITAEPSDDAVEDPANNEPGDPEEEPIEGEDDLGDAGKRALDSMKRKWKTERARRIELEQAAAEASKPGDGATPEEIRADAERSATQKFEERIKRAEVRGAARSLFKDPDDVLKFVDLSQIDVDENGDVDPDTITEALTDLLAKKPYLAKDSSQRGKPRVPDVPADPANKTSTPLSHADRVKAAQAAGDVNAFIRMQNELLDQEQ